MYIDDHAAAPSNDKEETNIIEVFESFKARIDSLEERQKESIKRLADELKKYVHSDMQELDEAIVAFWNGETKSGKRN